MLRKLLAVLSVIISCNCGCSIAGAVPNQGLTLQYSQNQPVTVTVSGVVRDKESGNPIPNATVRAHLVLGRNVGPEGFERCPRQEVSADAHGKYKIVLVTPLTTSGPRQGKDNLCVNASAPGYETLPQYAKPYVSPRNSEFSNFDFALAAGKSVKGVVLDPAGQPVPGAVVRVQNGFNGDWNFFGSLGQVLTAPDGSFELWLAKGPNNYLSDDPWLCIVKPGAGFCFAWDLLKKGDLGKLALSPGGEITGRVARTGGEPEGNCEVSVRIWPCDLVDKTVTDAQGSYTLKGIPGDPTITAFFKRKNGQFRKEWGEAQVHARPTAEMNLKDAPNYKLTARDGQKVVAPDLVVGVAAGVSGKLVRSRTALNLGGLVVRLDSKWEDTVQTDMEGRFQFGFVSPGKHTLTAYLPHNLRYDRGIGKKQVEVQPGLPLGDVEIQLEDLAELRVQYLDASGNPLAGIVASATWLKSGDGAWTEGTVSDEEGWGILYLYPDKPQFLRGFDPDQKLTAETCKEIGPQPAQVMEPVQITMVPVATLSGRLLDEQGRAVAAKRVLATLKAADGAEFRRGIITAADGLFRMDAVAPGILALSLESDGVEYENPLGRSFALAPGQSEDLGNIVLKKGFNKEKVSRQKEAAALQQPQEITQAAQDLFDKIRKADYDYFLSKGADWRRFPLYNFYQTHHWFDEMVRWMSTTFKTNPIVGLELGQPFANPQPFNGQKNLPTVPYKLTLQNGAVLQGQLPFEYNFDGGKGHWHGLEGVDWHLWTNGGK